MASDGNSAAGRALIDSVINATALASPTYPHALFWRATLATNAAQAESDYRHIVVDYPLSAQAEDALLRLAQLELARGDRDDALLHLQRIPRDYPRSKFLARASYWTARVLFEKNDIAGACTANANALTQAGESEIELKNQIQYQSQRCAAYAAAQRVAGRSEPPDSTPVPALTPTASTSAGSKAMPRASSDSSVPAVATTGGVQTKAPQRMTPPSQGMDTRPSRIEPKRPVQAATEVKITTASPALRSTYSVQVAAFNRKSEAEKLAATLGKRGYNARVDGTKAPFRVRIGRYANARDAEAALREIKSKHMAGFVVRAP